TRLLKTFLLAGAPSLLVVGVGLESANLYSADLFSPASPSASPGSLTYRNSEPFLSAIRYSFYYELIHFLLRADPFRRALQDHVRARLHSPLQRGCVQV